MNEPKETRLRFVSAKRPMDIVEWLHRLGVRVQIYGQPVYDGKRWYLWFVPSDSGRDIPVTEL